MVICTLAVDRRFTLRPDPTHAPRRELERALAARRSRFIDSMQPIRLVNAWPNVDASTGRRHECRFRPRSVGTAHPASNALVQDRSVLGMQPAMLSRRPGHQLFRIAIAERVPENQRRQRTTVPK